MSAPIRCGCGALKGRRCPETAPISGLVVVEYVPRYLRGECEAAGGWGRYPHGAAERVAVAQSCAGDILDVEGDWAAIVEGADAAEYAEEVRR